MVIRYNSYNQDYGLDVYEEDFIDDHEETAPRHGEAACTPTKRPKRKSNRCSRVSSSSSVSSDSDGGTKAAQKRVILSSDEEAATKQPLDSDDDEVQVRGSTRKRHSSFCARLLSSSSEEGEGAGSENKCRKVKKWESDEELE